MNNSDLVQIGHVMWATLIDRLSITKCLVSHPVIVTAIGLTDDSFTYYDVFGTTRHPRSHLVANYAELDQAAISGNNLKSDRPAFIDLSQVYRIAPARRFLPFGCNVVGSLEPNTLAAFCSQWRTYGGRIQSLEFELWLGKQQAALQSQKPAVARPFAHFFGGLPKP